MTAILHLEPSQTEHPHHWPPKHPDKMLTNDNCPYKGQHSQSSISGAHPTNDISTELKIRPKIPVLWFKMHSADHDEILHTSRQFNCRDVCKNFAVISWYFRLEYSNFAQISNSIKILLVGRMPDQYHRNPGTRVSVTRIHGATQSWKFWAPNKLPKDGWLLIDQIRFNSSFDSERPCTTTPKPCLRD